MVSDEALAAGLRGGELVIDRRLAQFMAQLEMDRLEGYDASARPDSDAARRLIAAALGVPTEP